MTRTATLMLAVLACASWASAQDAPARMVSSPEFAMSPAARAAGIDGTLKLRVKVDKDGSVTDADVIAGPAWPCSGEPKKELGELRRAVRDTALASKFSPAVKDGKPRPSELEIVFSIGDTFEAGQQTPERIEAIERGEFSLKFVKGGHLNGKALEIPGPYYPPAARAARLFGSVTVEVLVDENGRVVRAGAIAGAQVFHEPGRSAACSAKFAPRTLGGKPVKVAGFLTYQFLPSMVRGL